MLAITEASIVAITLGILTFCGVVIGGLFSFLGARTSRLVNRAVNNVPDGTAPLTDRVDTIERKLDHLAVEKLEDRKLLHQILDHLTK